MNSYLEFMIFNSHPVHHCHQTGQAKSSYITMVQDLLRSSKLSSLIDPAYKSSTIFFHKTLPAAADRISKENAVMQLEMGSPYLAHGSKCKKGSYSFFKRRNLTPCRAALYNTSTMRLCPLLFCFINLSSCSFPSSDNMQVRNPNPKYENGF